MRQGFGTQEPYGAPDGRPDERPDGGSDRAVPAAVRLGGRTARPHGPSSARPVRPVAIRGGAACAGGGPQRARPQTAGRQRAAAAGPALRLTRRGRVLLVLAPLIGLVVLLLVTAAPPVAASSTGRAAERVVTVRAGDTLWSLARRTDPDRDPRDVVADLEAENRLPDAIVVPGQRLVLPRRPG